MVAEKLPLKQLEGLSEGEFLETRDQTSWILRKGGAITFLGICFFG